MESLKKKEKIHLEFNLNTENYSFSYKQISKKLKPKANKFFTCFINHLNSKIRDERNGLIEYDNSGCEQCICWFCAFTIIGTIPFCCWFCKRKNYKNEAKEALKKKIELLVSKYQQKVKKEEIEIKFHTKPKVTDVKENGISFWIEISIFKENFEYSNLNVDKYLTEKKETLPQLEDQINRTIDSNLNAQRIPDYNQVYNYNYYNNNQNNMMKENNLEGQYQFNNNQCSYQTRGVQPYNLVSPMSPNQPNQVMEMGYVNNQLGDIYANQ